MNKMLGYLKGYKRESVLAPLFKMLEATFDLFVPLVMADIVNVGIAAHDFHYILLRCGLLLVLAAIGLTCSLTAQYFSAKAAVGYSTALRHALFEHIQSLSFSEMDTLGTSTLITRMTSDVNQVQSGLNLFLRLFLRSPFVVIGAMVMAFTVNFRAALIFVVTIPLLSIVVFGIMAATRPLYKTVQNRLDRVLGLTRENLTGVRVVRAFDKEQDEIDRFENANDLLTKMQLHVGHLSALMSPLTYVIINIAIVALLYVGSIEINVGGMASGDVIALVNYMNYRNRGFYFKAAFDRNEQLIGRKIGSVEVHGMDELEAFVKDNEIDIVVLTIPKQEAVKVAEKLCKCPIRAIWNFAHTDLHVPSSIQVENVHLSDSLMRLSYNIKRHEPEKKA